MDSIFRSSDEVAADPAWTSAAALNRSSSEWAFQKFLEDYVLKSDTASNSNSNLCNDVVEIKKLIPTLGVDNTVRSLPSDLSSAPPVNSNDDYQAFLKRQLDLACAAVARSREPPAKSLESVASPESQTSVSPQVCSQSIGTQDKVDFGTIGIPALPGKVKCSVVQVKSSTSGSSREQSEDDELEGETATNDNMDQSDDKRARRMLSNRESARRSRRRKQEQMSELETQVAQLRVENSSLLKRLTESNQKYSEASVDNRVLKADVETLRAKVMMAEDKVKRVTGLNTPLQPFSDIPSVSMVFNADASNARLNISGSFPPNPSNRMQQTVPAPSNMGMNNAAFSHNANRP